MMNISCFGKKLFGLCSSLQKLSDLYSSLQKLFGFCSSLTWFLISCFYRFILLRINPFFIQLFYFVTISCLGFGFLKVSKPRSSFSPRNLDLFFTSVSAATTSSMSTVEMEVFSNSQLIILAFLMFLGGEVFTSMAGLQFRKFQLQRNFKNNESDSSPTKCSFYCTNQIVDSENLESRNEVITVQIQNDQSAILDSKTSKFYNSICFLGFVVLAYLILVHFLGIFLVLVYLALSSSARNVLKTKELNTLTFSFFTIISTFAGCGFVPTNENMIVFSKNSGLLLILIPQVLLGNTLFPSCLRLSVWFSGKLKFKKEESDYLLKNTSEIGYLHLLPSLHSLLLIVTVFGFVAVQFVLFCSLDWNSDALSGLDWFEKMIGILFQTVNTRHTGETIVDLSIISPAILVLFIVMMYLPPYTSFLPVNNDEQIERRIKRGNVLENLIFSQLSYLVIFIILISITERQKMKQDPLNFNLLSIVLEVVSAYGNVGFTTGYNCQRQIHADMNCQDKSYGFSGKWSDEGKIILIIVMFFGRLKMFNMNGGRAWILL
ncbi:sodium transporter HKT1-like [Mercurialis annua]|uniref:sodium transporter HKT1-like n=1 Tax=Mercurialis annua TaxID=3986 RepID=UPI00215ED3B2|nr:sodium transporter HKT1-like [Mercurialis annua]